MNKIEVDTDSNGISVLELSHLDKKKYIEIFELMKSKDVNNEHYKIRVQAGAEIRWFDEESKSLCILFNNYNYVEFLRMIKTICL